MSHTKESIAELPNKELVDLYGCLMRDGASTKYILTVECELLCRLEEHDEVKMIVGVNE